MDIADQAQDKGKCCGFVKRDHLVPVKFYTQRLENKAVKLPSSPHFTSKSFLCKDEIDEES